MIWYFTPYSMNCRLFESYDSYMDLVLNPDDWVCFRDGDTLFYHSDFGHQIEEYVHKHPDTGLFTCYTNRIGNSAQLYNKRLYDVDSIKYHYHISTELRKKFSGEVTPIHQVISGHMMIIRKRVWTKLRLKIKEACKNDYLLRVDNNISHVIRQAGYPILRMDGVYILHYYRMVEGKEKRKLK